MIQKAPLTLLVVTAHPADGFDLAGGTIARHQERGDKVHVLAVTHGARSHAPNVYEDRQEALTEEMEQSLLQDTIAQKKSEFEAAATVLGVARSHFLGEEDEPLVLTREIICRIAEVYRQVRPDILITHHRTERNHHDHPLAGEASLRAVVTAARWLKGSRKPPFLVPTIYFYGPQSRQDATLIDAAVRLPATHVVDISDVIEKKKAALACFGSQKYQGASYNTREYMNRRIESMEGHWGLMHGSRYAEEFIARQPHQLTALLPAVLCH